MLAILICLGLAGLMGLNTQIAGLLVVLVWNRFLHGSKLYTLEWHVDGIARFQ